MGITRSYFITLLLYIILNEVHLPLVKCQAEESAQCIPKGVFLALLRLPEVSSNLSLYSKARMIQDAKNRNDLELLETLTAENYDDTEICIPGGVYLDLFRDPAMRGHLDVVERTQNPSDSSTRQLGYSDDIDNDKRSIAMLAKNDDLPISVQDRLAENQDDEDKRTVVSSEQSGQSALTVPREYLLPNEELDMDALASDLLVEKRNVGTLARDFALPPGRRNIASVMRDYELQTKGNNINGRVLPFAGKRNVGSLARGYNLPQNGKRNIASIVRDYGLPNGKRYVGSLARADSFPLPQQGKRNVASLSKNMAWPTFFKRGVSIPGTMLMKLLSRHQQNNDQIDFNDRRPKRQISFSDEYPLPVIQNTNAFDYEETMDALTDQYLNAEKRFMETGSIEETQPEIDEIGYTKTYQASKRHIGALARLGWLPSLSASRFSRSPRYLVDRENPTDGSSSNYAINSPTRSLRRNFKLRVPHIQALHGDC
ncbi:neuropeptide-like precursor 1 isoform X1 [Colletes latitarsis]|uniref:neuropeptide-like precursor 1 isoform X1 n=1 Tax=Colletes latitarsis TaxID=2605962 RepID=UPI004036E6E7